MLIFVKVPNGPAISVDVEVTDSIQTVKDKVIERLGKGKPFNLAYAGKRLEHGTLADYGIRKEATLHCVEIPPIRVNVDFEGQVEEILVPNNDTVTIREVKRLIRTAFPALTGLPEVRRGSDELLDSRTVKSYDITNGDTIVAIKPVVKTTTTTTTTTTVDDMPLDEGERDDLLSSFAKGAKSSKVEIVFSFDTTGSMSSIIRMVRDKVKETVTRLMKDIPEIRIGIMAHGDYCDFPIYVTEKLDLTDKVDEICTFVDNVRKTNGGGGPAVYELILREARFMSWQDDTTKALVVIGDEVPRPPSYTTENINWWEELDCLVNMGVKVYGVKALNQKHSIPFYKEISEKSGTVSINFHSFNLIVDMFLAICYREASPSKLAEFQEEVQKEGKMNEEMGAIFETLAQPNPTIPSPLKEKAKLSAEPWYDISRDKGKPHYQLDKQTGKWSSYEAPKTPKPTSSTTTTTTTTTTSTTPTTSTTTSTSSSSATSNPPEKCIVM